MHLWNERAGVSTVCGTLLPVDGESCTRDGEEVDCSTCLGVMAGQIEASMVTHFDDSQVPIEWTHTTLCGIGYTEFGRLKGWITVTPRVADVTCQPCREAMGPKDD